ncbi:MAG: DUF3141 domain-containing protein [Neomegalonema sp.]|nr:DUF3141 domain-containing protein [Neomegalonema sp.]
MAERSINMWRENAVTGMAEAREGGQELLGAQLQTSSAMLAQLAKTSEMLSRGASRQFDRISKTHAARMRRSFEALQSVMEQMARPERPGRLVEAWRDYGHDVANRAVLTLDTLRERGDIFLRHEAEGCPPVLIYDYEVVMDGASLPQPCNYVLLKILPPEGCEVHDWKRPYIIIDPRAGHGAGIGGFKPDSQVGVALRDGHPVYFVSFRREPEPGQTLASVTRAEAEFVREVKRRHPDASNPVVTGNCQGGWATLLLAATNPDLTGPICINGAPVATWAGEVGSHPMRYNAGVLGGAWQPMFWADMGAGVFDGAHLVMNFEMLNPSRSYFRKYYDLFQAPAQSRQRFLEFEKWWGGFFLLNEAEIRWIVEQLFVGNRLVKNEARLEPGRIVDLKNIRAPIIVFASHGDNITPPQQALNWILDTYADASEIQIRGQRIIYMVHDQIGHLGIFVSSKIAKKEHTEVTSTLKTIEALAPGLYEMKIDDTFGHGAEKEFTVSFHERALDDIRALDDGRDDEVAFAAVARASEMQAGAYELMGRPVIQALATQPVARMGRAQHPLRMQRALMSSHNPMLSPLPRLAAAIETQPRRAAPDNPFLAAEKLWADVIEQSLDFARDIRDAWYEWLFFATWSTPWARAFGRTHQLRRTLKNDVELKNLPEVQAALRNMRRGGFAEAVIRMLILLAESRGNVRRDRLERSARILTQDEPFRSMTADERKLLIQEQTMIVHFEPEHAIESLPALLPRKKERELACKVVRYVPGAQKEMATHTIETLQRFHEILGVAPLNDDVLNDPMAAAE